jgi:hypothetical protein
MFICQLCGEDKTLIKAHLIPECMYKFEKDMPLALISLTGKSRPKRSQRGIYDPHILCSECDGYIGRWDKHACEILHAENRKLDVAKIPEGQEIDIHGPVLCHEVVNADPRKLSLFVLSVIWRYHWSSREEAMAVQLGPDADQIRELLLNDASPNDHDYSVFLEYNPDMDITVCRGHWMADNKIRLNSFCTQGMTFHMKTDSQPDVEPFSSWRLKESRPVYALELPARETPFGKTVLEGLRKSKDQFGDPWKGFRRKAI